MGMALLLKPLTTALFFCLVFVLAKLVMALIPPGKLRTLLMSPIGRRNRASDAGGSGEKAK